MRSRRCGWETSQLCNSARAGEEVELQELHQRPRKENTQLAPNPSTWMAQHNTYFYSLTILIHELSSFIQNMLKDGLRTSDKRSLGVEWELGGFALISGSGCFSPCKMRTILAFLMENSRADGSAVWSGKMPYGAGNGILEELVHISSTDGPIALWPSFPLPETNMTRPMGAS